MGAERGDRDAATDPLGPPEPGGLRVAFLIYRGNPRCGGQGVYTRHLTRELRRSRALRGGLRRASRGPSSTRGSASPRCPGSTSTGIPIPSGSPTPASSGTATTLLEFAVMCTAGFGEPRAFSLRARRSSWPPRGRASTSSTTTSASGGACSGCSRTAGRCSPRCTTRSPSTGSSRSRHATNPWQRFTTRRWFGFLRHAGPRGAAAARGRHGVASRRDRTSPPRWGSRPSG